MRGSKIGGMGLEGLEWGVVTKKLWVYWGYNEG